MRRLLGVPIRNPSTTIPINNKKIAPNEDLKARIDAFAQEKLAAHERESSVNAVPVPR